MGLCTWSREASGLDWLSVVTAHKPPERGTDRDADEHIDQRILWTEGPSGPEDGAVRHGLEQRACGRQFSPERGRPIRKIVAFQQQ